MKEPIFEHFPRRHLILKESTAKDFATRKIKEAKIDAKITMPPLPPGY